MKASNPFLRRAVICAALLILAASAAAQQNANPGEERFEKRFALSPGATLTVENERGLTHVEAYDGKEAVVQVYRHVDAEQDIREWWLKEARVDFSSSPNSLRIETTRPSRTCYGWCGSWDARVELRIRVPRRTHVTLTGGRSETRIAGVEGDIRIDNERGSLEIEDTRGSLRAHMPRGSMDVRGVDIQGNLEISAERGNVKLAPETLGSGASVSGDRARIEISLPRGLGFDLDYEGSRRTRFHSDFAVSSSRFGDDVRGKVNGGGPVLRLRSDRGNIVLREGSASL